MRVLDGLGIEPCPIKPGQSWQNLIETQFNVQRRLADAKFVQAETFGEIEDAHTAFIQLFNTTRHWAHRDRTDDRLTPVAVLDGRLGCAVTLKQLRRVFRHLQFSRVVNRYGNVGIQRFYIYAERGIVKKASYSLVLSRSPPCRIPANAVNSLSLSLATWFHQDKKYLSTQAFQDSICFPTA